ncbi:MAG: hypothetical protein AAFP86_19600 [Planctomycetota bacterium]
MIRVSQGPPPPSLDGPESKGGKERAAAIAHHADPANADAPFKAFKAYKGDDVKAALHAAFHGKCAYCEARYATTQPMDVEHFRPKGGYIALDDQGRKKLKKPGYYWLAAEWDNLLPSCIDCNRSRTQDTVGADGAPEASGASGKANQFPIGDEDDRATAPDAERDEERLLLHPCRDFPERHLEFLEEGVIRPGRTPSGEIREKGEASISVYGLQRIGLVEARRDRQVLIRSLMRRITVLSRLLDQFAGDPAISTALEGIIDEDVIDLRRFMEDRQPFAAMARQIIRPFITELLGGEE